MSLMFVVVFREERVAWRRCAHVLLRSGHSGCMVNHTDLVVNGNFVEQSIMSDKEVVRTTDSIDCETNEQIWHVVSLHFASFRLEWSEGNQQYDVLKPGTCLQLIGRYILVG